MLALKPVSTAVQAQMTQQKPITPFSLEAANALLAPISRQINIIPDDGSCLWYSHTKDPKSAVVGRLADQKNIENR